MSQEMARCVSRATLRQVPTYHQEDGRELFCEVRRLRLELLLVRHFCGRS